MAHVYIQEDDGEVEMCESVEMTWMAPEPSHADGDVWLDLSVMMTDADCEWADIEPDEVESSREVVVGAWTATLRSFEPYEEGEPGMREVVLVLDGTRVEMYGVLPEPDLLRYASTLAPLDLASVDIETSAPPD